MLSFFPRGVLDEILNLIESVSEGFPSYSYKKAFDVVNHELLLRKLYLDGIIGNDWLSVRDLFRSMTSQSSETAIYRLLSIYVKVSVKGDVVNDPL